MSMRLRMGTGTGIGICSSCCDWCSFCVSISYSPMGSTPETEVRRPFVRAYDVFLLCFFGASLPASASSVVALRDSLCICAILRLRGTLHAWLAPGVLYDGGPWKRGDRYQWHVAGPKHSRARSDCWSRIRHRLPCGCGGCRRGCRCGCRCGKSVVALVHPPPPPLSLDIAPTSRPPRLSSPACHASAAVFPAAHPDLVSTIVSIHRLYCIAISCWFASGQNVCDGELRKFS